MIINEIRVYAEVLEQGIDFKSYVISAGFSGKIVNIYTKKARGEFDSQDSIVDRIRKVKDVDILISAISNNAEYPLLMVEYSTAVPTDDHKMQRSDVYYWSSIFKVPMMKISPSDKGMDQDFGGGDSITDEIEQKIAFERGALFFPVNWDIPNGGDVLPTKKNALSCIPNSTCIKDTLSDIISAFNKSKDFDSFYNQLKKDYSIRYAKCLSSVSIDEIKRKIVNSTRFHWYGNRLSIKINRFGHAMDPDRGVLYYVNMLVGCDNTIAEIQINRPEDVSCRGGYNALFDALARKDELLDYVNSIIEIQSNVFSEQNALRVFTYALNIENVLVFQKNTPHEYSISDNILKNFLISHPSMVAKTIFFLATELRLTDVNRDIICTIKWNKKPIQDYLNSVVTPNRTPIEIKPLTINDAKEDIITFASVELYKKLNYDLLAVSYPGAQGDRCILTGSGRNVLRTYVDIIAYSINNNGIEVFLEECKEKFANSRADEAKLNDLVGNPQKQEGLKALFRKTICRDDILKAYTAVAAKKEYTIPRFSVDYIFMFDLRNDSNQTYIDYSVAIINTSLVPYFKPLTNNGKLLGTLSFDKLYIIK